MQLHCALTVLAAGLVGQASTALASSPNPLPNKWHPCPTDPTWNETYGSDSKTECMTFTASLCYPGICEAPANASPTIDVFVKRLPATSTNAEEAFNVWMVPGGPGGSFASLESYMETVHANLNGSVNVYTMDPRGAGLSTGLDCASLQTTNSSSTTAFDPSKVPSCAKKLHMRYGDLAAFSTTSSAMDIATFISKHANGARTVVYGASYGTVIIQRLMHLNPSNVTGYVLDSIVTSSGSPVVNMDISTSDTDFGGVGDLFMDLCAQDKDCSSHFPVTNLSTTLLNTISRFEIDPNSTCATLIRNAAQDEPSIALRQTLGSFLVDSTARSMIPPLVYRLNRCDANDVNILKRFFELFSASNAPAEIQGSFSFMIYYLVSFSEAWETPTPSYAEMMNRFTSVGISYQAMYHMLPLYCAFSKEKSPGCDSYGLGNYEGNGVIYSRDQYWNKTAVVPDQASVLLLSGKLDPQTHYKYAESLFKGLDTPRKELLIFDYAPHMVAYETPYGDGTRTCGMDILASYVANNGDLSLLDKSCMSKMPAMNMTPLPELVEYWLGTDGAYDGVAAPLDVGGTVALQHK